MTQDFTRRGVLQAGGVAALASASLPAYAQSSAYPTGPVRFILPFPPGGPSDMIARVLSANFDKRFGKPFLVESRPGAASNIGTAFVARSAPDGHTLLIPANNFMINASLYQNLGYDPIKDFAPITELAASPCVFVSNANTGIKTVDDLIARDRADPGKLNYSSAGVGTPNHMAFELFNAQAKLNIVHVPFQGGAPSALAVLTGTTQMASSLMPNVLQHIETGALNALAVTGSERAPELPSTPTLVELGYKDIAVEIVFMLLAPAGTPQPVIDRLYKEAADVLNSGEARERMKQFGFTVVTRGPEACKARIEKELAVFAKVVADLKLPLR
jgi:tripartite-type tricarboxylate transporter receptor subunit TctC